MKLKLMNVVILANNYQKMVDWYINALGLEMIQEWTTDYHYAELAYESQLVVGITPAKEIDISPPSPRNNATIIQLEVSDIKAFYERIKKNGGVIVFGPSYEEKEKFYFGAVNDIEGNQIWVIQST